MLSELHEQLSLNWKLRQLSSGSTKITISPPTIDNPMDHVTRFEFYGITSRLRRGAAFAASCDSCSR